MMSDHLEPLPTDIRDLLDRARAIPPLVPAASDRLLGRIHATLGLPPGTGGGGDAGPDGDGGGGGGGVSRPGEPLPPASRSTSTGPLGGAAGRAAGAITRSWRVAATMLALGVGAGAGLHASIAAPTGSPGARAPAPLAPGSREAAVPTLAVAAPAPVLAPPAPLPAEAQPDAGGVLRARTSTALREPNRPGPADRDAALAAERAQLELARTALQRGHAQTALGALRRHETDFPRPQLLEEREALFVLALVAAGEVYPAWQRAERFRRQFPRSLFAPVVDGAVASIPSRIPEASSNRRQDQDRRAAQQRGTDSE